MDVPVVVVTHDVPTDWVDPHPDAQEIAGDRVVAVTAGTMTRHCLELGLIDEVAFDLAITGKLVSNPHGRSGGESAGRSGGE
jgi:hypothetical protein